MYGIPINVSRENEISNTEAEVSNTLMARDYKGIGNQDMTAVCVPVLTPERPNKRQNGRRFKENGEPSFTLTAQDRHGVAIGIDPSDNFPSDSIAAEERMGSANHGFSAVLVDGDPKAHEGIYVDLGNDCVVYAVWNDRYDSYIAIRRLTPRECFRLQGFNDDYYDKAEFVNSDTQLYKQAGNAVTTTVVYEVAKNLASHK